jgi:hypothetical protein
MAIGVCLEIGPSANEGKVMLYIAAVYKDEAIDRSKMDLFVNGICNMVILSVGGGVLL